MRDLRGLQAGGDRGQGRSQQPGRAAGGRRERSRGGRAAEQLRHGNQPTDASNTVSNNLQIQPTTPTDTLPTGTV